MVLPDADQWGQPQAVAFEVVESDLTQGLQCGKTTNDADPRDRSRA